jgi:hypothetical protein
LKVTLPCDFFCTVLDMEDDLLNEEEDEEVDEALEALCSTMCMLLLVSLKAIIPCSFSQLSSCGCDKNFV